MVPIRAVAYPAPMQLGLAIALLAIGSSGQAQTAATAKTQAVLPPVFTAAGASALTAPDSTQTVPDREHAVSPALSAALATVLPAYENASADSAQPAAIDKPKNLIPRLPIVPLPQMTVRDRPIPEFTERESYTKKGLEELAETRYMSWLDHLLYNKGLDHFMVKEGLAMRLYDQDEDNARWKEIGDLRKLDAIKDPAQTAPASSAVAPGLLSSDQQNAQSP